MSTYLYLECLDHDPPLRAEAESGQHLYDLPQIRRDIANRDKITELYMAGDFDASFFRNSTARFLAQHRDCRMRILDEFGDEHALAAARRIYVASSWRCAKQPAIVTELDAAGHEVYDFRNPPGSSGFGWSEIDPSWKTWTPEAYRSHLQHPRAAEGFRSDFRAMAWADTFVLVLPCGRSAHLEAGWAIGQRKPTAILLDGDGFEPELMYRMADKLATSTSELLAWLATLDPFAGGAR